MNINLLYIMNFSNTSYKQVIPSYINKKVSYSKYLNKNNPKNIEESIGKNKIDPPVYDIYSEYLLKNGITSDDSAIVKYYINVDSADRKKVTKYNYDNSISLGSNPFDFNEGSDKLFISHDNHSFNVNDIINISGVSPLTKIIRTFDNNNVASFNIPLNCNFMKIFVSHSFPLTYSGNDILVSIKNIIGDDGSNSSIGNIPVNLINGTFPIKLKLSQIELNPDCDLTSYPSDYLSESVDHFFIILPRVLRTTYNLLVYNYAVSFSSIGGIPIKYINGNQKIVQTFDNGYSIKLNIPAAIDENGGGNIVKVNKLLSTEQGYPNNNNYSIDLSHAYDNIKLVRLVSIDFPNTQPLIIKGKNDKLYWQNIDDNDHIYSISIPSGNYTPEQLKLTMQLLISEVTRINTSSTYSAKHNFIIDINQSTNIVKFSSFKKFELEKIITNIEPAINATPTLDSFPLLTTFLLTLNIPKHGVTKIGTTIMISGSTEVMGIAASFINSSFAVESIIDENNIKVRLPKLNLTTTARVNNRGGNAINIFIPELIRLRFDNKDTLGYILGFRNPGDSSSITSFSDVHTNYEEYENETETGNNSIQMAGENYVCMLIEQLNGIDNFGAVKQFFAKINLCDLPGTIIYNSNVNIPFEFNKIIDKLKKLDISFKNKDGSYFDFNGIDHSFVLEITSIIDKTKGTNIHPKAGKIFK